jgi:hypothetical protein
MLKKKHVVSVLDIPDFVQLLTDAVHELEQGRRERVHSACDRMEDFLSKAGTEIREMLAIEMFEGFQNVGYPFGSDSFAQFFGPEMKRLWAELQAIWKRSIMLDLRDRSVLEAEVLISRIVRQLPFRAL